MDKLPEEQLKQGMLASSITHQGSDSHLRRQIDQRFADESPFIQRKESNKLFVSSWTRLLGVAFTSLAAAYFLLLCFRFIESARQWSPPTRSLADRRGESCYSGSVSGDGDEGGSSPTGDSAGLVLEGFEEGSPLLHHEASGLQGAAGGTQEEVVAAGLQGAAGGAEAEVDLEAEADEEIWEFAGGVASNPQIQYDLHLWEGWNMPVEEEQRLLRLFEGMKEAASSCRSLLPVLTHKQRLQLTIQVLKLLTLDLGAMYLVREDKEPHRRAVGDFLIKVAQSVLDRNGEGEEDLRANIKELIVLLEKIKEPRYFEKEMGAAKYKRKMISIIGTAETALKNCMGVLNGLLGLRTDTSAKRLPWKVFEQQLSVLKTIYHVHSYHIAKDSTLRVHILESQKSTAVFWLLGNHHLSVSQGVIAPLKDLLKDINDAVRAAGGLLPSQEPDAGEHGSASSTVEERTAEMVGQHAGRSKPRTLKLLREKFAQEEQPPSNTIAPAPHTEDGAQRSPRVLGQTAWSSEQLAGPFLQQHLLIFNERLQAQSPYFRYPHTVIPVAGPSMSGSHAQGGKAFFGYPCSPWPCTSLSGSSYLSTTQHPANPPGSSLLQEHVSASRVARNFSGGSSGVHLTPATPLSPMNVNEPPEWLQPPAPIQERGYSLFGSGGIPPWFPFSQATPASFERRATASDGWPRPEEDGAHRLIKDDGDKERNGIPRDRTQSGRQ